MSRRRNVNIVRGQYEGRTGTILRFDGNLAYIQIDGGTDAKSDGTAKAGCALRRWIRSEHWERTGDTPRKEKPRYDFGVRESGSSTNHLSQTPENYPIFEFMEKWNVAYLVVTHGNFDRGTYFRFPATPGQPDRYS